MKKCIDSLLVGGEAVEIIIVDDGSKDATAQIADTYQAQYPTIVKAIHQENGGHGEAVNTGLLHATGKYFKVVDSDDWVDATAYQAILKHLSKLEDAFQETDIFIANYVYEKVGVKKKRIIHYTKRLPEERLFSWDEMKNLRRGQYLLMHSVIYRTELLKNCGLLLPKHTFYVDNLFVYEPLPHVKNLYYLNVDFYRYFIGRDDQSVNEQVMIKRIDQQLLVNKRMIDYYVNHREEISDNKVLEDYMQHYLEIITTVSTVLLVRSGTKQDLQKRKDLWRYLKISDQSLYVVLRKGVLGRLLHISGKYGKWVTVAGYKIARKLVGFN
jgi:glycosyltransferase involved in cell wall biosynthesis